MDIIEELERAIPQGPPLPTPAQRIAAGRAALRRRRLALVSGAAVAVVALVVPVAALGGGTTDRGTEAPPVAPAPATPDQPTQGGQRSEAELAPAWPRREDGFAYVDLGTGELRIHPAAVVHERRDDLYPGKGTESVALNLSVGDQRQWILLEWDEGGSFGSIGRPEDGLHETFDAFVSETTGSGGMTSGPPPPSPTGNAADDAPVVPADLPWLSADLASGEIRAVAPGRLLDQLVDVRMPASFAPPGTPTAAALAADDEGRYLALFRGEKDLVVVEATGHGDGIEELLAWARERYRSGAGLL